MKTFSLYLPFTRLGLVNDRTRAVWTAVRSRPITSSPYSHTKLLVRVRGIRLNLDRTGQSYKPIINKGAGNAGKQEYCLKDTRSFEKLD